MRGFRLLGVLLVAVVVSGPVALYADPAPKPVASLPWLMRPTAPATLVRSDTAIASFDGGTGVTTIAQGNLKLRPDLAVGLRLAVNVLTPDQGDSTTAFANPALLVLWAPKLGLPVQLAFTGVAIAPLGQGGGADADPAMTAAVGSGVQTRQGMDNALFATNYATGVVGAGATWLHGPLTVTCELTVLQLVRVRDVAQDDFRTNLTSGLHLGYAVWGPLTVSGELHYQYYLSTPSFVEADEAKRSQASWLVGVRGWWKVGNVKLRPGLSYARAIDAPMGDAGYSIVQVDLPFVF